MKRPQWRKPLHSGPVDLVGFVREYVFEDTFESGVFKLHTGEITLPGGVIIHFRLDHQTGSLCFEATGLQHVPMGIVQTELGHEDQTKNNPNGHVYVRLERVGDN